jgi:hypothetical protein
MYTVRDGVDRYDPKFLNERENFFHKPQINLNWYHTFSDVLRLATTAYFSGGKGGGTGTYGYGIITADAVGRDDTDPDGYKYYYGPSPWVRDWDKTIAINEGPAGDYYYYRGWNTKEDGESLGILRNSVNQQWTIGVISKATYNVNDNLKVIGGLDWRTAEIDHFRQVRDLLGGEWFYYDGNDFDSGADYKKKLGDKIAYNNTNTVDWIGAFAQAEYTAEKFSVYGTAGVSSLKYHFVDHFKDDGTGDELTLDPEASIGYQIKGGGLYRVDDGIDVFANFGLISKAPIFDGVIDDVNSSLIDDPSNEEIISIEGGVNFVGLDGMLTANLNVYNTNWNNRVITVMEYDEAGLDDGLFVLRELDAVHQGVEAELAYQPMNLFRLDGALSIGNWEQTSDSPALYKSYEDDYSEELTVYTDGLKIGDAPQTQLAIGASVFPIEGLSAQVVYKYYDNYYADYNISQRIDSEDKEQSWQIPSYGLMDLHLSYWLPFKLGNSVRINVFAHVFNALDATYIQDALDNSDYNAWDYDHDADDAEVFFGLPRFFNVGAIVEF